MAKMSQSQTRNSNMVSTTFAWVTFVATWMAATSVTIVSVHGAQNKKAERASERAESSLVGSVVVVAAAVVVCLVVVLWNRKYLSTVSKANQHLSIDLSIYSDRWHCTWHSNQVWKCTQTKLHSASTSRTLTAVSSTTHLTCASASCEDRNMCYTWF